MFMYKKARVLVPIKIMLWIVFQRLYYRGDWFEACRAMYDGNDWIMVDIGSVL